MNDSVVLYSLVAMLALVCVPAFVATNESIPTDPQSQAHQMQAFLRTLDEWSLNVEYVAKKYRMTSACFELTRQDIHDVIIATAKEWIPHTFKWHLTATNSNDYEAWTEKLIAASFIVDATYDRCAVQVKHVASIVALIDELHKRDVISRQLEDPFVLPHINTAIAILNMQIADVKAEARADSYSFARQVTIRCLDNHDILAMQDLFGVAKPSE